MNIVQNTKKNRKGFTLVELVAVILILVILAAILVPALIKPMEKRANETQIKQDATIALSYIQKAVADQSLTYFGAPEGSVGTSDDIDITEGYEETSRRIAKDVSDINWGCRFEFDKEYNLVSFIFYYSDDLHLQANAVQDEVNDRVKNPIEWNITY